MVVQAATGGETIQMFKRHHPDVTLMDLRLPDVSGMDSLIAIRTEFPGLKL
jgi:CheY-like chemotaxis protein